MSFVSSDSCGKDGDTIRLARGSLAWPPHDAE
jgi:hypothetical protein